MAPLPSDVDHLSFTLQLSFHEQFGMGDLLSEFIEEHFKDHRDHKLRKEAEKKAALNEDMIDNEKNSKK